MLIAVAFGAETEKKRDEDENEDTFLFRGKNQLLPKLSPTPSPPRFQRASSSLTRGRTRSER